MLQADEFEKSPLLEDSTMTVGGGSGSVSSSKPARVNSLDTFRGISLFLMIFVNYGGKSTEGGGEGIGVVFGDVIIVIITFTIIIVVINNIAINY